MAAAARTTAAQAQAALEFMVSLGLAEAIDRPRRSPRRKFRPTGHELVVRWVSEDSSQRIAAAAIEQERSVAIREAIGSLGARSVDRWAGGGARSFAGNVHLTPREQGELARLVGAVERLVLAAQQRDDRRSTDDAPANVAVLVSFVQVGPDTAPVPAVILAAEGDAPALPAMLQDGTMGQLAPRERQVAVSLAMGMSRKEIAAESLLAEGTIVTLSRRIYRKLGVHNRAQLATRLGGWPAKPGAQA